MAKLFEEVLSGSSLSPSADVVIHFAEPSAGGGGGFAGTSASSPGGGGRLYSPRTLFAPPLRISLGTGGVGSPTRCAGSGEGGCHSPPVPLRCHSLVLRTQPSLLEKLGVLAALGSRRRSSSPEGVDAELSNSDGGPGTGAPGSGTGPHDGAPSWNGSSAESQTELSCVDTMSERTVERTTDERMAEVTVEDEPEVFLEMIKFVYLNTCHVDHANVKALLRIADKYGVEDIVILCLQWLQENFTADLFFQFLSFELKSARFGRLLRQSLRQALRSRRHFSAVTGAGSHWEQLPVSFLESLFSGDDLPVVSEAEVLHLLSRWASGVLQREMTVRSPTVTRQESPPLSPSCANRLAELETYSPQQETGSEADGSCSGAGEVPQVRSRTADRALFGSNHSEREPQVRQLSPQSEKMLRLLRAFRKSDMTVKASEIEPILDVLNLKHMFSTKPPRESATLDPGFMIYRGVAGVNAH